MWLMPQRPHTRAANQDRETTVDRLVTAYHEGRLATETLEFRAAAALAAKRCSELDALVADLGDRESFVDLNAVLRLPSSGTTMTVGRGNDAELKLEDPTVSRQHAVIWSTAEYGWVLTDLRSLNGTYINGQRVIVAPLAPGDHVTFGEMVVLVEKGD